MSLPFHPAEPIAPAVQARIRQRIGAEGFAQAALVELPGAAKDSVLRDLGRFFERYHALDDNDTRGAMELARALYLDLLPDVEAAAEATP